MAKTDGAVTIYHNPNCGTSRNALAAIRAAGYQPTVVEYLKAGWTKPLLTSLIAAMGASPRDILRVRGTAAADLGLDKPGVSGEAIIAAMVRDPALVERPIVVTAKGTALCRPVDKVQALL